MALLAGLANTSSASTATLIPSGSIWHYLDNGTDPGTVWRATNFNDSGWVTNRAQFGYGDGDEATLIYYGTNQNNKFITTYFRSSFNANPAAYSDLTISLLRDDGAVVYLNGREVFRSNMPGGSINYRTLASANVSGADESTFYSCTVAATNLVSGKNVLAVEIHQATTNSTDISFDLQLVGNINTPPISITAISPSQDASNVTSTANLQVALDNVPATNLAVTIYGRTAAQAGPDFTIIALPDTQYYVSSLNGGKPETFTAQTDWIVSQKAARNIAFVTHLGDCVENGDNGGNPAEWYNATNAMYRLENPATTFAQNGIPYGIAVGNHDQSPIGNPAGSTRFFNEFFGTNHFSGRDYYGGHYSTNNNNHFELFSASGLDFIILHVEYDPAQNTNVINWANSVLQAYSNRRAIIVSHSILAASGNFSAQGQKIFDGLKANPNVFMMLSGHDPGENRRSDTVNGHTIHSMVSDFQGRTNGGSGFLRILEFSPSNNVIRVKTYSPTFGQFETDADSQFTLSYDMGAPMTALASFTGVCSTTNLSASWPGLSAGATYQWCVGVSDGATLQSSPMWQFTTAAIQANPQPGIGTVSIDRATQTLVFSWPTAVGSVYQLVYRDNVAVKQWLAYSDEITADASTLHVSTPIDASIPARFFALKFVR